MCFNAPISHIDDHPRDHALIAKEDEWNLSPSYDLMPSPVIAQDRGDLAMTWGDKGRFACASNILSQHSRFLLRPIDAQTIVESMRQQQVSATWYDVVRAGGVSERMRQQSGALSFTRASTAKRGTLGVRGVEGTALLRKPLTLKLEGGDAVFSQLIGAVRTVGKELCDRQLLGLGSP
jgi:hypothetical protein